MAFHKSRLLLLALGIALGIGGLVSVHLLESRAAVWDRARVTNTNLLFTVSHVVDTALQAADRSIRYSVAMAGHFERQASEGGADDSAIHDALHQAERDLFFPSLADDRYGIQLILDHTGTVVAASRPPPASKPNFSHRQYFRAHQQDPGLGLYLSPPFISDYDRQPSVAMSRRWQRHDGSFGGVVVQTFKLSSLQSLFSSFELDPDSGITLFLRDGSVLTHFPYGAEGGENSVAGAEWFEHFKLFREGSFAGAAGIGPVNGLHVFRSLNDFPVVMAITQSRHSILSAWSRNAGWLALATLFLMSACVWLAVLAERRMAAQRLATDRLGRARLELHTIVENLPVLVSYWDAQLTNRMANVAHRDWTGLSPDEMFGLHISECVGERQLRELQPRMEAALTGESQVFDWETRDFKGRPRHAIVNLIPDSQDGRVKGFFVTITDISDRRAVEIALLDEKERFRVILESIKDGVITTNCDGEVNYLNPAAAAMIGWGSPEVLGKRIEKVMSVEDPEGGAPGLSVLRHVLETGQALDGRIEQVLVGRRGERTHIENWAAPILDKRGRMRAAVNVFHEVGQIREMANKMAHLAQHDALTGLPNRRMLDQVGQFTLVDARSQGRHLAILYLDLDGFKQVNDEYGHAVGDELLIAITRRLSRQLRANDVLYRQGGDEFVVLGNSLRDYDEAVQLTRRLIACCQTPVSSSGGSFSVTLSIGISMFPDDGTELGQLIQRADRGMYAAKNAGRNRYARVGASTPSPDVAMQS